MKNNKILAIIMAVTMVSGTVALSGCGTEGKSAYDIWLEQGNTGTEQDFLNSLKGTPGTPGDMPEITISDDGYWEINGQKTSQKAQGENGTPGQPGERGNKITKGEGAPTSTEGAIEGDMYVDTKEWNVYFFESGAWKDYGSIKGADDSEESPQYKVVKDFGKMTISTEEVPLDLEEVNNGTYFLVVESDSEAVANNLTSVIGGTQNYDMYCPLTKGYKSVVVKGDSTTLSLKAATQSVTGNVKLIEYSAPAIKKAGETYEVPVLHRNYGYVEIDIDSSFRGHSVNVVCHNYVGIKGISIGKCDSSHTTFGSMTKDSTDKTLFTKTITIPADCEKIYFNSLELYKNGNITVQIILAD